MRPVRGVRWQGYSPVMTRYLCLCAILLALLSRSVPAQDIDAQAHRLDLDYPAGSLGTLEASDRALLQAQAVHDAAHADLLARKSACSGTFFYTRCVDAAVDRDRAIERIVERVELEAHDFKRHHEAQRQRDARREESTHQTEADRQRSEQALKARETDHARGQDADSRLQRKSLEDSAASLSSREAESRRRAQEQRLQSDERERPIREQQAQIGYGSKQREAADHAKSKLQEKSANEQKRQERDARREAQNRLDAAEANRDGHAAPASP